MDDTLRHHFIESGVHLRSADARPWQHLKMLESRELCAALIERRHDIRPSTEQSLELATAIAQGRQYFESARSASHLARPLLLYYGALSLSRSVILASRSNGREANLSQGHGLQANRWKEILARANASISDLEAEVNTGTFAELTEATKNRERAFVLYDGRYLDPLESCGTEDLLGSFTGRKVSLLSLLSRVPDLQEGYRSTFGGRGRAHPTIVYSYGEIQYDYFLINLQGDLPSDDELRHRFGWPSELEIVEQPRHHIFGEIPGREIKVSQGTATKTMLESNYPVKNDRSGFPYLVEPFSNGYQLSTLSMMFAISYFAGMMVRYFPSRWAALNSHQGRDKEHSLLILALDTIEERFPQLVLEELESVERLDGQYRRW